MFGKLMNLFKLKTKEVSPNVYALLVESEQSNMITLVDAYTLEDAREQAFKEFKKKKPDDKNPKILIWSSMALGDLFDKYHEGKVAMDKLES